MNPQGHACFWGHFTVWVAGDEPTQLWFKSPALSGGALPIQGLHKMSNSPALLCTDLLKSQLCLEGRQLWLAGTYGLPVPQELSLNGHLGLWSQPMSRSRDVGFIPLCCQPLVSTQPFPITGTVYKGCKGGGYGRFSLAKKSQEK